MQFHPNMPYLFKARSVAVIDDNNATTGTLGQIVLENLLKANFSGELFFIHKHLPTINNLACLHKIADIPEASLPLDLCVICSHGSTHVELLQELGKKQTKAVIIIGTGFGEHTEEALKIHADIKEISQKYNMAILGPKSLGTICMHENIDTTVSPGNSSSGNIGFFSQSEAMCITMFNWLQNHLSGYSAFISLGTKAGIDEADAIAYLAKDKKTKVITGHLESIAFTKRFLENAAIATSQKPVIILKSGKSTIGARAASAHSGASSYEDFVYDAIFKQTGIIRANTTEDLFAFAKAFATQPLPKGNSVAIITNDGGTGVIAADACEDNGLSIAELSAETIEQLKTALPKQAYLCNPINTISSATPEQIAKALDAVSKDTNVHSVILLITSSRRMPIKEIAEQVIAVSQKYDKPLLTSLLGSFTAKEGKKIFVDAGIPCYPFPEKPFSVLAAMYKQSLWKDDYTPVEITYRHDATKAKKAIQDTQQDNLFEMSTEQAQNLLRAYEIPVLETKLATTSDMAVQAAKQLGLPVALKIACPDIESKSEAGGVFLNILSKEKVRSTFTEITSKFVREHCCHHVMGCFVQSMAPANSREVIMGFKRIPNVGVLVHFGLGGIHAEIFKDVSWRITPLSLDDVYAMTREIKAFPILAGGHGQKPANFNILEDMLLILSQMARDFPEIRELELNPVMVNEDSAFVVDMSVKLESQ